MDRHVRRDEDDAVELECVGRLLGDGQVRVMDRVEDAAEDAPSLRRHELLATVLVLPFELYATDAHRIAHAHARFDEFALDTEAREIARQVEIPVTAPGSALLAGASALVVGVGTVHRGERTQPDRGDLNVPLVPSRELIGRVRWSSPDYSSFLGAPVGSQMRIPNLCRLPQAK